MQGAYHAAAVLGFDEFEVRATSYYISTSLMEVVYYVCIFFLPERSTPNHLVVVHRTTSNHRRYHRVGIIV